MNLSKNSRLYRYLTHQFGPLGTVVDNYDEETGKYTYERVINTCDIVNRFFGVTLAYFVLVLIGLLLASLVGDAIAWFSSCTINGFSCFSDVMSPGAVVLMVVAFFGALFCVGAGLISGSKYLQEKIGLSDDSGSTSAIKKCIQAKKEKICIKVNLVD